MEKRNILLLLTGGTICSFDRGDGKRASDTHRAEALIVRHYQDTHPSSAVSFDTRFALDILSENMTVAHWNSLLDTLRTCDFSAYDGMILLHGTDTLAYTASLLSLVLSGIPVPVFLVSAALPLTNPETNGTENFRAAVSLIERGISPNVYAVYRNSDGVTYLHLGAHLRQCANGSDDFFSADMRPSSDSTLFQSTQSEPLLDRVGALQSSVLRIEPYVGLNYDHFSLDGVRAVLHGTYHSCTACVGSENATSLLSLLHRTKEREIPVFLSPCDEDSYAYETTGEALASGAIALSGMTPEMTYVKLLVALSLGLQGNELTEFLQSEHCGEFIL